MSTPTPGPWRFGTANGDLIIAAPALLAALERAGHYIRSDYTLSDGTDGTGGLIAQIDAAIALARGQT